MNPENLREPRVHEKMPGLVKIPRHNEKPTVRAWTASHSCGDWILWASSRTAICGLGDKQTTLSDTDPEATWLALLGLFLTFPFNYLTCPLTGVRLTLQALC